MSFTENEIVEFFQMNNIEPNVLVSNNERIILSTDLGLPDYDLNFKISLTYNYALNSAQASTVGFMHYSSGVDMMSLYDAIININNRCGAPKFSLDQERCEVTITLHSERIDSLIVLHQMIFLLAASAGEEYPVLANIINSSES